MNLLKETNEVLEKHGYSWGDVAAIQGDTLRISVERFKKLADVEYDEGFGAPEVASDLVILMKDGSWFTRAEYDGSEWWAFHKTPERLPEVSDDKVRSLVCSEEQIGWRTLEEINTGEEDEED